MHLSLRTIVLVLLGGGLVLGLGFTAFRTEPVPIDLATIERGTITVTVNADGETRIREIYEVSSPIAGTSLRMPVRVGDPVVGGETVVARVEPAAPAFLDARTRAQAEADLHEAEAFVEVAKTELIRSEEEEKYALTQFNRSTQLVERGASSLTRLEDDDQRLTIARATVAAAVAQLTMAESAAERARAALIEPEVNQRGGACCMDLLSPVNGVVLSIESESERPVQAGDQLLSVGDPRDLEIVADLLSSDATRLKAGAPAIVERWGGEDVLTAELELIEPSARTKVSALGIEEQRVDAILTFTSPPAEWAGVSDGFSVFLRIEEWRNDDVLLIPLSAIFQRNNAWFTYVVENELAQEVEITIGRRDGIHAELLGGVETGQRVILHPADSIAEGVFVAERSALR
ncbi:MAG: HlyD family efflux transporter periplasmic adaptor subunit [Pseudomonadota bacterium]